MPETGTSGLMSGEGKTGRPAVWLLGTAPFLDSTSILPVGHSSSSSNLARSRIGLGFPKFAEIKHAHFALSITKGCALEIPGRGELRGGRDPAVDWMVSNDPTN